MWIRSGSGFCLGGEGDMEADLSAVMARFVRRGYT